MPDPAVCAGTIVDKSVDRLLKGKTCTILQCMNVDFRSTKQEEFIDLQLDVISCKSVYESLEAFCKVRRCLSDATRMRLCPQCPWHVAGTY